MANPEEPRFICPRCHYHTNHKSHFIVHLNKKNICPNLYSMADPKQVIQQLNVVKDHVCDHPGCDKSFAHHSGLWRHKKTHEVDATVAAPPITINNNSQDVNTTTTNTHSHNTTTTNSHNTHIEHHTRIEHLTVNILPFGHENTSHVEGDSELLDECIGHITTKGIPDIVEAIFFNEQKPENHNVKVGRANPPELLVYKADANGTPSWRSMERTGILHEMVQKGARILIRYNDHVFSLQQERGDVTEDDRETYDWRSTKLTNINRKERGSGYAPIKQSVLLKAEEHTKKLNDSNRV